MAWGIGEACPKPARGRSRKTRLATRLRQAKAMRDAVWLREMGKSADGYAYCQRCKRGPLERTTNVLQPTAGHVAHQRGRNVAPEDKYNPDACDLECRDCHLGSHGMRFGQ